MIWVLEQDVFSDADERLAEAVTALGHEVKTWDDGWLETGRFPKLSDSPVLFHGSLGNAAKICAATSWRPGSFCDVRPFHCTVWYPKASPWLLHQRWHSLTVASFVADPGAAFAAIGTRDRVFVRPDSPLKPFAGRVVERESVSLKALDHGYYFDDVNLSIIVAPVVEVAREWRFVVCAGQVIAGSGYLADGREEVAIPPGGAVWSFAQEVVADLTAPEVAYVLDVCESAGELRLLELNPLSGADWYACDRVAIVRAIAALVEG